MCVCVNAGFCVANKRNDKKAMTQQPSARNKMHANKANREVGPAPIYLGGGWGWRRSRSAR